MQIILNQTEIEQALVSYISTRLAINTGQEIVVEMTAGRGADGYRATVEIKDAAQAAATVAAPTQAPAPATTRKPKADEGKTEQAVTESKPQPEKVEAKDPTADAPFDGGTDTSDPESGAPFDVAEETPATETTTNAPAIRKPLFGRSATALNA